jgi:hypothetical protein
MEGPRTVEPYLNRCTPLSRIPFLIPFLVRKCGTRIQSLEVIVDSRDPIKKLKGKPFPWLVTGHGRELKEKKIQKRAVPFLRLAMMCTMAFDLTSTVFSQVA